MKISQSSLIRIINEEIKKIIYESSHVALSQSDIDSVRILLQAYAPVAKNRFKEENIHFLRALSKKLKGITNVFKRRAIFTALKDFEVDIKVVNSIPQHSDAIGFYTLSRDQEFYKRLQRLSSKFDSAPAASQEEIEAEIKKIEDEVSQITYAPFGEITLSASEVLKKYYHLWERNKEDFIEAVLSQLIYEEITHFLDFFIQTLIRDIMGKEPYTIERRGDSGYIMSSEDQMLGPSSEKEFTLEILREKGLVDPEFNIGGDNTALIQQKWPAMLDPTSLKKMNDRLLNYIAISPELLVALSELKNNFQGRIDDFFNQDVFLSGAADSFKLAALYVLLDHSKARKLERYLRRLSLPTVR